MYFLVRGNNINEQQEAFGGDYNRIIPPPINNVNINEGDPVYFSPNLGCHPLANNMSMPSVTTPSAETSLPTLSNLPAISVINDNRNINDTLSSNINDPILNQQQQIAEETNAVGESLVEGVGTTTSSFSMNDNPISSITTSQTKKYMMINSQSTADAGSTSSHSPCKYKFPQYFDETFVYKNIFIWIKNFFV